MVDTPRTSVISLCLDDFLLDAQAAQRALGTLQFYRQKLTPFVDFATAQGVLDPASITPALVRSFLVSLQAGHSPGGIHAYWRALRAYMRFLVREGVIDRNPLAQVRAPHVHSPLLDPLSFAEFNALLDACDLATEIGKRDAAIFLTLLDSGLRAGELCGLLVGDVNLADGSISVRKTKNRRARVVFIAARTRRALRAYLRSRTNVETHEPLFLAYHTSGERRALTYAGLRSIVTRRADDVGIAPPPLHSFRRAFALTMLRSGADLMSLSRLMGHGSLPVLQRYLKQLKEDLGQVHLHHSPVDTLLGRRRRDD